jgi:RND family efflux transporter MFP subunit
MTLHNDLNIDPARRWHSVPAWGAFVAQLPHPAALRDFFHKCGLPGYNPAVKPRRAQSSVKWVLLSVGGVAVAFAGILAILHFSRPKVVVTEVVEAPVVQAFYATGTVQPVRDFPIKSNVEGTIEKLHADKGDRVKHGQSIVVVSDPERTFNERKAAAELEEKRKRADAETSPVLREIDARIAAWGTIVDIAQREEQRLRKLVETNAASQQDLELAINRLKTAWSELESFKAQRALKELELQRELDVAQAAYDMAKWNLEEQTLKSPVDGAVLDRPLSVGTRVAVNDPITTVADVTPENLVVRAAVDEEDVAKVHVDQKVHMTLYAFPGRVLRGTVSRIYDQADADRRTFEVDVKLDEPEKKLLPGMTGELAFIMQQREKALVVPSQAVRNGEIWIVDNSGRLSHTRPEIGISSIERVEIRSGLRPGDRVVISAGGESKDGQRVRTTYMDPAAAAGLNRKADEKAFNAFQ